MKSAYITVTGTNHYFGTDFIKHKMVLTLIKEPDNKHDKEAIRVELQGLGKIGYVANSTYTVLGESISAGRLYDKIGESATASVRHILSNGIICKVKHLKGE